MRVFSDWTLLLGVSFPHLKRDAMKADELVAIRLKWCLTQDSLAHRLGMCRRSYIDLEMGRRPLKRSHVLALERISIDLCIVNNDNTMLMPGVRYALDYITSPDEIDRKSVV